MFPFLPIYYKGKTKFTPIHVTDLTEIIFEIIKRNITNQTIECIGPEVLSFKDIILKLSISIDKKILLIPLSPLFAKITTKILEKFPKPILTTDQLKLLKYDNIISGKYKTNFDLGINSNKKFENEIAKYSFNWKKGGQFSKKISNNN
tara:strand:- start:411 stop:854 length:444 start_codon:yes stop_codon:yes gene_type:complete